MYAGAHPYLCIMYQALFILGYYGLMRVGELTLSPHTVQANNVHVAYNKEQIKIVLYSFKTHDRSNLPQEILISSTKRGIGKNIQRHFCPFKVLRKYMHCRGGYVEPAEPFFIFYDRSPVTAAQARKVLRTALDNMGLNSSLYDMHSFRIRRAYDMIKFHYSVEEVKRVGQWKSSSVYRYIHM